MIAVIFEVWPRPEHKAAYLDLAASLYEELRGIEGFVSVERFQSLTDPDKLLSLSVFEDETALDRWRNLAPHRAAQARGRAEYFADYRLRVTSVIRDYGKHEREQAPADSRGAPG